ETYYSLAGEAATAQCALWGVRSAGGRARRRRGRSAVTPAARAAAPARARRSARVLQRGGDPTGFAVRASAAGACAGEGVGRSMRTDGGGSRRACGAAQR